MPILSRPQTIWGRSPDNEVELSEWATACFKHCLDNAYENMVCEKAAILPGPQCVNSLWSSDTIGWQIWVNIGSGNGLLPSAITWTNVDLSSKVFFGITLREISQEALMNFLCVQRLHF